MRDRIEAFLTDVDQSLASQAAEKSLELYHIGRSALVWHYGYTATTNDLDFLRPEGNKELIDLALRQFGKGTAKALEHGLYLEVVEPGWPPMPGGYKKRATQVEGPWKTLHIYRLEEHDLVASKLRRFSTRDRADIRLLCDLVTIDPERLEHVLEEAYPFILEKDGDEFRDSAFRSLRTVQRYLRGEISEF